MTAFRQNSTVTPRKKSSGWLVLGFCGILVAGSSGCVTLETTEDQDQRMQYMASMNADIQTLAEERQKLIHMLEASRQETAQLTYQVRDLSQRLDLVEKRFANIDASYKQSLDSLNAMILKESTARKTAIQDVVTSVSSEISKTASQLQEQQRKLFKSMETTAQGDYVVQKGDNLDAIAKAFGISRSSLLKANKLNSANLRVGQKLVIPKP